jgi:hypothetical protein
MSINKLLDIYNDYKILYNMFGDYKYKQIMDEVLRRLEINNTIEKKKR